MPFLGQDNPHISPTNHLSWTEKAECRSTRLSCIRKETTFFQVIKFLQVYFSFLWAVVMSWFFSSSSSNEPTKQEHQPQQPEKEQNPIEKQPADIAELLKLDLRGADEETMNKLKAARLPVIQRIQNMTEQWKAGDVLWYVCRQDAIYVARQKTIQDAQRYKKDSDNHTAMMINHKLHNLVDFSRSWNETGEFLNYHTLFPIMNNDREIIRAMLYPYVVLFDH